ncbi:MAG TPA: preprotein translocase subunit SecG [bacterium]|nr:preprotein translocase subunit SecG [bacterium]HPQ67173.1 preprotein translocase subunit SecG [bacterium]
MLYPILIALYVVVCVALVTIVLLQSGKGDGLAGVFGGGGGQAIFGARTGDLLTRSTTVLAVFFMLLSLILAVLSTNRGETLSEEIVQNLDREQATAAAEAPSPGDEAPAPVQ